MGSEMCIRDRSSWVPWQVSIEQNRDPPASLTWSKLPGSVISQTFPTIFTDWTEEIGYILSERIRSEYEEFKEAESQLQLEYRKVQFEFDQRVKRLDSLKQDYEVKRLMSLDKGESIKQEIEQTEKQIQTYQAEKVGPQGELMRKQAQMEYDILGKVKKAVDKVAINGGYDYIIDASVGLLYYKPKYDLTDDVLHELRKLDTSSK